MTRSSNGKSLSGARTFRIYPTKSSPSLREQLWTNYGDTLLTEKLINLRNIAKERIKFKSTAKRTAKIKARIKVLKELKLKKPKHALKGCHQCAENVNRLNLKINYILKGVKYAFCSSQCMKKYTRKLFKAQVYTASPCATILKRKFLLTECLVCNLHLNALGLKTTIIHQQVTLSFCSKTCLKRFTKQTEYYQSLYRNKLALRTNNISPRAPTQKGVRHH